MTVAAREEKVHPDGRHELTDASQAALADSPIYNDDLAPVRIEQRTWNTYAYFALWVGMAINVPSWTLAAGLIALGMDWVQAVFTVMLGNVIVLIPMLLNSHAGTKYGIPYPVFARASFGVIGANVPALHPRRRRVRLVRHPDLDRGRGDLRARRLDPGRRLVVVDRRHDRNWVRRPAAMDPVVELRGLLAAQPVHHPARHEHAAHLRELVGAVPHRASLCC